MVIEKTPPSTGEVAVPEYLPRRGRAEGRVIRVVSWRPGTSWMARGQKSNRKREDLYDFIWYLYDFIWFIYMILYVLFMLDLWQFHILWYLLIIFSSVFRMMTDDWDEREKLAVAKNSAEEFAPMGGDYRPDGVISLYPIICHISL